MIIISLLLLRAVVGRMILMAIICVRSPGISGRNEVWARGGSLRRRSGILLI